jgi:hypothetical protein
MQASIMVGLDFNVSPMTAVVANVTSDKIHIFDEVFMNDSNTNQMAELLRQRYGTNITVIPDATGKALKTSSRGFSDHEILRGYGFNVSTNGGNPFRMDRYNTVNNLLEKNRIVISDRCVKLIKDLEQVAYKDGTNLPDTKDLSLTHVSDALGYLCWSTFPILPRKSETKMIQR